ncbi:hypothetical protein A3I18_01360 [Candidatus Campbellbacteria bacterium RIFCSPLOWO2_02_FULL_35_11]|uniref:Methylenetetrahydrofolate reductase n=2 Tax=Candidatus Campbelliibacteriota TaxID=1752727 RepID=A0A1F5EMS3_9BACT|nr:MAG: hypothetical protein A3E89_01855 [Candidatus Campbellbacteria bacterium RIFCSPHIGHO2_12_FULL_35_10]OGD70307.1 MAG: hypothetical protein A3I18_01360 [Candidatus Campbellbacteria bacterium RIFCSPLOWO2_02_FULL_35_11]
MDFQNALNDKQFPIVLELSPVREPQNEENKRKIKEIIDVSGITAISITESPMGVSAMPPEELGSFIKNSSNLEVILHLSCKGRNRTQIKSRLESYYRKGLTNLLVVTGDYPKDSKPVFDLDSVQVLDLIACLEQKNCGLNNKTISLFAGAVCSPLHPLQELQRQKLDLKIQAGARFIVTQVGYDFARLKLFKERFDKKKYDVPVLGNIFIPNLKLIDRIFRGEIPGCTISKGLYNFLSSSSSENILKVYAWMMNEMRKMGFVGIHLGGPLVQNHQNLKKLLEYFQQLQKYPEEDFYRSIFYSDDENSNYKIFPTTSFLEKTHYQLSSIAHKVLFNGGNKRTRILKKLSFMEHTVKAALYGCKDCGECTLPDSAFLCPQSGCAKQLLNGPCGGTREGGWCEVYPTRLCFWVRVALRNPEFKIKFTPPKQWGNIKGSWDTL